MRQQEHKLSEAFEPTISLKWTRRQNPSGIIGSSFLGHTIPADTISIHL